MEYLDACAGVTDLQWLDICSDNGEGEASFWTIDQVVPWDIRAKANFLAARWLNGIPPKTSLECWFRRLGVRVQSRNTAAIEPWIFLLAMAHAWSGRGAPSPSDFCRISNLPIEAPAYQWLVSVARAECPDPIADAWNSQCN